MVTVAHNLVHLREGERRPAHHPSVGNDFVEIGNVQSKYDVDDIMGFERGCQFTRDVLRNISFGTAQFVERLSQRHVAAGILVLHHGYACELEREHRAET